MDIHSFKGITSDSRRGLLRKALQEKRCIRLMETHSPISALLAEGLRVSEERSGLPVGFDGFWSSSLTDSTARGKPDIEALDIQNRLANINDIFEVTRAPLVMDGDTGGKPEHFALNVRSMERLGVSCVIIEDKTGLKKNSLLGTGAGQEQDSIESFCHKLAMGKRAQISEDFMIVARIESLILDAGMEDALGRASAYIGAGADGIMIHSRRDTPAEVCEFATRFKRAHPEVPLVCVPTSYSGVHFAELEAAGFNVVIYANHMLRSAYIAMQRVASEILRFGRTKEIESQCMSISEILSVIPGTR